MEVIAESKFIRISPRKVRLVADAIRSISPKTALLKLPHLKKRAAVIVMKTLKSAVSNALNNAKLKEDMLRIKEITVNEGPRLKRFRPGSRGRTRPYVKRASHLRIVLEEAGK